MLLPLNIARDSSSIPNVRLEEVKLRYIIDGQTPLTPRGGQYQSVYSLMYAYNM